MYIFILHLHVSFIAIFEKSRFLDDLYIKQEKNIKIASGQIDFCCMNSE